jgi:hypothetical protein
MNFKNPGVDQPLFTELSSQQVITQAEWNSWSKPDEGNLTDVFVHHAGKIRNQAWIYWLVKRHNLVRVPNPEPDAAFLNGLDWHPKVIAIAEFYGLYPLGRRGATVNFVSLRPDVRDTIAELLRWLRAERYHLFALTPRELTSWRDFVRIHK